MTVLTESEALEFLAMHGLGENFRHLEPEKSRVEYDTDVGRRCAYSKVLTDYLLGDETTGFACLDISGWNVYPSSTNMDLFDSYRGFLGEPRSLIEAHFHVFTAAEAIEFRNILHLALISLFDVGGASTTTDLRFFSSHDGYIEVSWYEGAAWLPTMEWFFAP